MRRQVLPLGRSAARLARYASTSSGLIVRLPSILCGSQPAVAFPPSRAGHLQQRRHLIHDSSHSAHKNCNTDPTDFAFVFDIDGVLLHSSEVLPGAAATLSFLHAHNIPFILLTNGGGKHEEDRVAQLSEMFGVPLSLDNFVQSHTPFMEMVTGKWEGLEGLQDGTILVTAHDQVKVREIALKYGFKNVVTPGDILTAQPKIWPFSSLLEPYYRSISRPLPADPLKVDALLVFSDPFDWALDTQIIMDLLLSKDGVLGTYSEKNGDPSLPNRGYLQDGQPKLVFSNPDLWWASGYPLPRLGQGGFRTALQGVWDASTDRAKLDKTVIGKPSRHTYLFAERVLQHHREDLLGKKHGEVGPLKKVFMVGDNPASDIKGANEFESPHGTSWDSVLVRTGVYQEGRPLNEKPKHLVDGVREGVILALREMGYQFDPKELED